MRTVKTTAYFFAFLVLTVLLLLGWLTVRENSAVVPTPTVLHVAETEVPARQENGLLSEDENETVILLETGSKDRSQWEKVVDIITLQTETANQVTKVIFYLGRTLIGEATESPFTLEVDTTVYDDCMYILRAIAYDEQGEELAEDRSQIWIDNTPDNCM